jgi:hypothetical protein
MEAMAGDGALLEFRIVQVLAFGSVIYLHAAGEGDL